MQEGVYETAMGSIHYWMDVVNAGEVTLVFLPGLTADHRLFDKQIEFSATASTYSSGMCRVMRHRGRSISTFRWTIRRVGLGRFSIENTCQSL